MEFFIKTNKMISFININNNINKQNNKLFFDIFFNQIIIDQNQKK